MSALITQLVQEEPAVICVGTNQPVEKALGLELTRLGARVETINIESLNNQKKNYKLLLGAYKVVCCVKPSQLSETDLTTLLDSLQLIQSKTILVMLVDTAIQPNLRELDGISQWRVASDVQERNIRQLCKKLDRVRIVFCQDLCQENTAKDLPIWKSLFTDASELIDPQTPLFPNTISQMAPSIAKQVILPLPQPSVLIRGHQIDSTELTDRILQSLRQKYMRTMRSQLTTSVVRQLLPFPAQELVVPSGEKVFSQLVDWFAQLVPPLPQPKHGVQPNLVNHNPSIMQEALERQSIELQPRQTKKAQQVDDYEPTSTKQLRFAQKSDEEQINTIAKPATKQMRSSQPTDVDIAAELQRIFTPQRVVETVNRVVTIAKTEKATAVKGRRKRLLFAGGVMAVSVGIILFAMAGVYAASVALLKHSLQTILSQEQFLKKMIVDGVVGDDLEQVDLPTPLLIKFVSAQTNAYGGVLESTLTSHAQQYTEIASLLPQAAEELATAQKATKSLYSFVIGNELGDVEQLSNQLTTAAQNSYELLSKLQAALKSVDLELLTQRQSDSKQSIPTQVGQAPFEQALAKIRKTLVVQQQLHTILPQLLGEPTKRTYAIVFQNSQELRPTGGFLQSVAVVTFANGSMVNSEVLSSYELDGKLRGSVQPPEEIQRYLGEKQWFLRDSNWDPHFPNTAGKIAWFIDQTMGVQLDGVASINMESLESLLSVIGPIEVPEYNEVITHKNLKERMEFHSEVVLAPESNQRDYSTIVLEKVLAKITTLPDGAIIPTLSVLQDAFSQQEVALALFAKSEGELVANLGWSGGIVRPACPAQLAQTTCVVDYLYPVEANVGVNKANAYIARSVEHDVYLEATVAAHTHTLRLENTARSNAWPKGAYKNYVRFMLPENAMVRSVAINGNQVSKSQLNTYVEQGLTILGVEVSVPIQQQTEVVVQYQVPQVTTNQFSYAFFLQKQPGVRDVPTIIRIHSPAGLHPARIAPTAVVRQDVVEFNLEQTEHMFVGVEFK